MAKPPTKQLELWPELGASSTNAPCVKPKETRTKHPGRTARRRQRAGRERHTSKSKTKSAYTSKDLNI